MSIEALTVTRLARRMRNLLEIEIGEVWVEGEISNLRKQSSGHWYFSLKDSGAQLSCAAFSAKKRPGSEHLEDGAKVKILGEVSFYESRGQAQLILKKAAPAGLGDLQAKFEALKEKLKTEGLFDESRRKPLPFFPRRIGLITSPTGAALQDIMNVLQRRAPWLQILLFQAPVQGKGAEKSLARAVQRAAQTTPTPEVLIIGRGGGSLEDLWNFNEEILARAIANSPIPIISAVGHETDFTIADFVADLRAPTPSAAAELVAPDRRELLTRLAELGKRLQRLALTTLESRTAALQSLRRGPLGRPPERLLREPAQRLDELRHRLRKATETQLLQKKSDLQRRQLSWQHVHPEAVLNHSEELLAHQRQNLHRSLEIALDRIKNRLERQAERLRTLGPQSVLERGYTITTNPKGTPITSAARLRPGTRLTTTTAKGSFTSLVEPKKHPTRKIPKSS